MYDGKTHNQGEFMATPIESTKKQITDLQAMVLSSLAIFKKTDGADVIRDLKDIKTKASEILADQRGEWPNPKDLDEAQRKELGEASFAMLTELVKQFKTLPV